MRPGGMSISEFRSAAIEYAQNWFRAERRFVDGLASSDRRLRLDALQAASAYFIISRNFPKRFDVERGIARLLPVLTLLDRVGDRAVGPADVSTSVRALAHRLGAAYGGKYLLSAASKFLWHLHRDVVVIYDSRDRTALRTRFGDYDEYLEVWLEAYGRRKEAIQAACAALSAGALTLAPSDRPSPGDLRTLASQEWFRRRVHDIYLWHLGAPKA